MHISVNRWACHKCRSNKMHATWKKIMSSSNPGLSGFEVTEGNFPPCCVQLSTSGSLPLTLVDHPDDPRKTTKNSNSVDKAQKTVSIVSKSSSGGERPPEAHQGCPRQPRRQHFSRQEVVTIFKLRPNIRSMQTVECVRRVLTIRSKQVTAYSHELTYPNSLLALRS